MIIGGFQRFSLIDYPDKICAIVFTQGCNFRCPYCHNPELVDPKKFGIELKEDEILSFLGRRKGKLNAVTITGGEPLLQTDLSPFLSAIKRLGYLVKLDTNGSFPSRLKKIIELESVDYVAMDIKTSLAKYPQVIKTKIDTRKILDSIRLIMDSGLDYEFRTTIVKALFEKDDFYKIGQLIKNARLYVLQKFVPSKTLDDTFLDMK
ncbi:MAG TPA: anaerobic ribonucleoside-triphosphate reductase activating protein, partial [Desulfobacteraceae bacterium]|nr:anaerobic ribonucleoside-triphosphate reductase activating protein [Desulfobacteraceae bacterium]